MEQIFTVYVLYSSAFDKIYIGYTNNLLQRFKSHNCLAKKGYTIRYRPWLVVHTEIFYEKQFAIQREKQLKSAKGRLFIWENVIPNYL